MPWSKWFPAYVWADPSGRAAAITMISAAFVFLVAVWALFHFRTGYRDELYDLGQDLLPRKTYTFSPTGELEVYEEGVRIMRNGTCVSPMLHDVWEAARRGAPGDRVMRVKWLDDEAGPCTTDVRCGAVDEESFGKLKEMIEHYGKG